MATITRTSLETQVNVTGPTTYDPSVTALADGGYVVVWTTDGGSYQHPDGTTLSSKDVYARRYDAAGVALSEFRVDDDNSGSRFDGDPDPWVTAFASGGFRVDWWDDKYGFDLANNAAPGHSIQGRSRVYDADGSPNPIRGGGAVYDDDFSVSPVELATTTDIKDTYWEVFQGLELGRVVAEKLSEEGFQQEFVSVADTAIDDTGVGVDVARLTNGSVATVWSGSGAINDGSSSGVFLQMISDTGTELGPIRQVNTGNTGTQNMPVVAAIKGAGFVVAWTSNGGPGDVSRDVRAQLYDQNGGRIGGEFLVNTDIAGGQYDPAIVSLSGGGFVIAWETDTVVMAQRYAANGARVGGEFLVSDPDEVAGQVSLAALKNDGFAATWTQYESSGDHSVQTRSFQTAVTGSTATAATEIIDGTAATDVIYAAPGVFRDGDEIYGRGGVDRLVLTAAGTLDLTAPDVFSSIETLVGTSGDDTFIVSADRLADVTSVSLGAGTNTFLTTDSLLLSEGLNVTDVRPFAPSATSGLDIYGNSFAQRLSGDAGRNYLDGGGGNDTLTGGGNDQLIGATGDDTFRVASSGDAVVEFSGGGFDTVLAAASYFLSAEASIEVLKTQNDAGRASITLYGNEFAQAITGNAGANLLDGEGGADTMAGLGGSDNYFVDNAGDRVVEANVAGTDIVYSSVSFTLGNFVENLDLSPGSGNPTNGTGNGLANEIVGNNAANRLDGKGGADRMYGLGGDDIYTVDNAGDRVYEFDGFGTDSVFSSVTFTLAGQFAENLTLTGAAAVNATGNGLDNILTGNAAANVVNGGTGADSMRGGGGNDTYVVDDAGDVVTEARDAGADRVLSSVGLTLSNHVENLTLTGTGDIAGAGNDLANTIVGNAGRNALDGRTGADVMAGGAGNDSYVVDNARDRVIETNATGYDTVYSSVSFSLAGGFAERLILTGPAVSATGNALDNNLQGTAAANVLIGGAGADAMLGGAGDDVYYVDDAGDQAIENAGEGIDTVNSTVSFSLFASSVENVVLSGAAAIDATGNDAVNKLVGGTGRNVLNGGLGADVLTGNAGFDTFFFNSALGPADIDRITDFVVADDAIRLENAVFVGLATGVLAADAFVVGAAAQDAEDRIVYDQASGRLLYDADGDGVGAAQQFAFIAKGLAMTRADFVVV